MLSNDLRFRRRHRKSKNGCARCKVQRKKCDERQPSCTRCATYGYPCSFRALIHHEVGSDQDQREVSPATTLEFLSPVELSLLRIFVLDTSRAVAYDAEELYVLQVGIPMLAKRSRPLTASMLALSTASKCHHFTRKSTLSMEDCNTINDLLVSGDRYYDISLHETRLAMSLMNCYDNMLANATLLVLYGLASYSVRIRIEEMTKDCGNRQSQNWTKVPCQWMRLIRSTFMAYNDLCREPANNNWTTIQVSQTPQFSEQEIFPLPGNGTLISESGPSRKTELLFLPIVVATYRTAFQRLQIKFEAIKTSIASNIESENGCVNNHQLTYNSCLTALEVLINISSELFDPDTPARGAVNRGALNHTSVSQNLLSQLRPWLRAYVARVTSVYPSKPLRRTITSFLNRIPTEYFNFIQEAIENMAFDKAVAQDVETSNYFSSWSALEQVALETFTHWLVLVMLLDGVWWIGNIGKWELGRLIKLMENQQCTACQQDGWWPKSMWNIQKEISSQQGLTEDSHDETK